MVQGRSNPPLFFAVGEEGWQPLMLFGVSCPTHQYF